MAPFSLLVRVTALFEFPAKSIFSASEVPSGIFNRFGFDLARIRWISCSFKMADFVEFCLMKDVVASEPCP